MARGTVSLVFDDGYERVYENVVPLLEKYRLPAVFAVPLDTESISRAEHEPAAPWQTWLSLKSYHHEIAAHSISHLDLTQLSDAELEKELAEPARALSAATLVYPGGAVDNRVKKFASRHYSAARTVARGIETTPPAEPMMLKTINWHVNNWSLLKANLLALYAFLSNRWLIETFHMVDDDQSKMIHTVKIIEFERHLAFINKLPINIKTIRDTINRQ